MNTISKKNKWITNLKREYWEHQGSMLWLPVGLMSLILVLMFFVSIITNSSSLTISYAANTDENVDIQHSYSNDVTANTSYDTEETVSQNINIQPDSSYVVSANSDVNIKIGADGVSIQDTSSKSKQSDVDVNLDSAGIKSSEMHSEQSESNINFDLAINGINISNRQVAHNNNEPEVIIDFSEGPLDTIDPGSADFSYNKNHETLIGGLAIIHFIFFAFAWIAAIYYIMNSLFADRRDGSILFWKSLPVSETQNVLCKLFVALLVYPLVATIAAWITQLGYIIASIVFVSQFSTEPWSMISPHINVVNMTLDSLVKIVTVAVLTLPLFAWLSLASALAKRSPLLIATLPLLAVMLLENWLWNSNVFFEWIMRHTPSNTTDFDDFQNIMLGQFSLLPNITSFDLLSGVAVAAILTAITIWCRNNRFEI